MQRIGGDGEGAILRLQAEQGCGNGRGRSSGKVS